MAGPVDVFISYAPVDDSLREELEQHLSTLQRAGVVRTWSARCVVAGDRTREVVEAKLAGAEVVLLLVSASYLASDYLYEVEATVALGRERAGKARVLPVLLRACDLTHSPFEGLSPLPANGKPVSNWSNRDDAWVEVVRGIRSAIGGAAAPAGAPVPAYESPEIRAVAEDLERARIRRRALIEMGASTKAVDAEILQMRRTLREGGQLRAGDALGDGRYWLLDRLGKGGFGSVWRARDTKAGEDVAIKVLHPSEAQDPKRRDRFFRGARVMAKLKHPAIVRVREEQGQDGGYHYFVMDLVAGPDLQRAVTEKRLHPAEVVPVLLRVAEALGEAHAQGIVHRDVKPSNIVLDVSGQPKLTDFDLVGAQSTTGGTRTGALGTFHYAAPEQLINAQNADARADVFGLGITTVFCLRGEELPALLPYKRDEVIAGLPCSDAIRAVVSRAIALEPTERYADARAFGEALRRAATPPLPVPPPPELPPPGSPEAESRTPKRLHPLRTTVFGGGAAAVGLLGFLVWMQFIRAPMLNGTAPTASASATPSAATPPLQGLPPATSIAPPEASSTDTPMTDTTPTSSATVTAPSAKPLPHRPRYGIDITDLPGFKDPQTSNTETGTISRGKFDHRAAQERLQPVADAVAVKCGEAGSLQLRKVTITFATDGTVASVSVDESVQSTVVRNCIRAHFLSATIPPFDGSQESLVKMVSVRTR